MIIGRCLLILVVTLLLLCVISYISVPVYDFEPGRSFVGSKIYNPYAELDSMAWRKANFHAHQREKPPCDYTVEEFLTAYREQGYDLIGLADHQVLNLEQADRPGFIPAYEHGYGLNGYHQLMLGATQVTWREFPVMLTHSQMQFMLKWLRPRTEVLVLNHPGKTRIVDLAVYGWLRGYDLFEINPDQGRQRSDRHWDVALSSGIYSNLIANDDAHHIDNRESWFQRCFTMLNASSLEQAEVLDALKAGRSYGVVVPGEVNTREHPHADLPRLQSVSFRNDTIGIRVDRPASSIRFIGQHGALLAEQSGTEAYYPFVEADTYVRAEAHFDNGVILYFNPFVRTADGKQPVNWFVPVVNYPLTILCHLLWIALTCELSMLLLLLLGLRRGTLYYRWNPRVIDKNKSWFI